MNNRQAYIIETLSTRPEILPDQEYVARVAFLRNYLAHTGLKGFVLGISGGQDSLLAGLIAQQAVSEHRAEGHDVSFYALLLPYGQQADRADAELACETIRPDKTIDIDIKPAVDAMVRSCTDAGEDIPDFHIGNIKARQRMIAHYAIAGIHQLAVIGTDHAAEAVTGFFTKYGDGGADVLPLAGLTKSQGKQILKSLKVPDTFITKAPTADLLDGKPGQPDEVELGLSYDLIDAYLCGKSVPADIAAAIEQRFISTEHKRQMPVAFSSIRSVY